MKKDLGRNIDLFKPRHKRKKRPSHYYTTFDFSMGIKVFGAMTRTCVLYNINLQTGQKYQKFVNKDKKIFYDKYVKYLGKEFENFSVRIFKVSLPKYISYKTNREYHLRKAYKTGVKKRRTLKVRRAGLLYSLQYRAYVFYILKLSKIFVDAPIEVEIERKRMIWGITNIIKEFCSDFFNEDENAINYKQYEITFNRAISLTERTITANALSIELVHKIEKLKDLALKRDKLFEHGIEVLNIPETQFNVQKSGTTEYDENDNAINNNTSYISHDDSESKSIRVINKEKYSKTIPVKTTQTVKGEVLTENDIISQNEKDYAEQKRREKEKYDQLADIERIQRATTLKSAMLAFSVVDDVAKQVIGRIKRKEGLLDFDSGKVPIIKQIETTFKMVKDLSDAITKTPQVAIQINNGKGETEMKIQEGGNSATQLFKTGLALSQKDQNESIELLEEEVKDVLETTQASVDDLEMYKG